MKYINKTQSGLVRALDGKLAGFIVNTHVSGTLALNDGIEAGVKATSTLTSGGAYVPASHGVSKITSSGAMVAATHAVTVFTATSNFSEGVKASAILTSNETQPTAAQAVVVGDITYTFVAKGQIPTNGATACNVPLGGTTAETMVNLYNALCNNPKVDVVLTSTYVITITAKAVGTAGNSIAATENSATLDFDGTNTTLTGGVAADTITIGAKVYTPKAIPTDAYDFLIGANLTASLVNLKNVINGTLSFGNPATHTQVIATASDATTVTLRGRVPGTSLNTVATTETCANASFPDTTLGGGTGASDPGVATAGALITIGTTVYTVVDVLSETYGATAVAYQVLKGANEAAMLTNLKKAINGTGTVGTEYSTGTVAHPYVIATTLTATTLVTQARSVGNDAYTAAIIALPTTTGAANTAWEDTTFGGGTGDSNPSVSTDASQFIINGRTYTFVVELSETSGSTAVVDQILAGANVTASLANAKKAINASGIAGTDYSTGTLANYDVVAGAVNATTLVITAKDAGTYGNAITTTENMANTAWTSTVMASGTGTRSSVILNTITFPAVTVGPLTYNLPEPVAFDRGLFATFGGTSADITFIIE